MYKGNPPRFVMGQCRHEHMELTRGEFIMSESQYKTIIDVSRHFLTTLLDIAGNYKSQIMNLTLDEVKPEFFIPGPSE